MGETEHTKKQNMQLCLTESKGMTHLNQAYHLQYTEIFLQNLTLILNLCICMFTDINDETEG